jgi:uncharacterized protein YgbK (DUF1537 family)
MKIGAIGDDFTGSGDIANTLAKAGAHTVQYAGVPSRPADPGVDAAVIALKTRSIPPDEAVAQSLAACRWLIGNGAAQIVFKYCSTFDSTPQGNIGPVAAALLEELGAPLALVCPAFPANGRTVYQGHLFVQDRLLSESGMENHPLTPMTDPNIRRWLQRQTVLKVGHLPLAALRAGPDAALACLAAEGARLVVADAVEDADLFALGRAAAGHRLVTGGSGIAMGLPANFGIAPETAAMERFRGVPGPAIVLSGSCSGATRRQVAAYVASRPAMKLDASALERPDEALRDALAFVADNRGAAPLVYSTDEPAAVAAAQARLGRERLAAFYDGLFARLAAEAVARGFRRIVVAGGETSGAVAGALGETAFAIGPEIATGVPTLRTNGDPALALALKSGNFGDEDFFERALRVLEGDA